MKINKIENSNTKENNKDSWIEQIPYLLDSKFGMKLECPKCHNKIYFKVFFESELISTNAVIDNYNKIWRIETPNIGVLKIKDIKCTSCGIKNSEKEFIKYE